MGVGVATTCYRVLEASRQATAIGKLALEAGSGATANVRAAKRNDGDWEMGAVPRTSATAIPDWQSFSDTDLMFSAPLTESTETGCLICAALKRQRSFVLRLTESTETKAITHGFGGCHMFIRPSAHREH